MPISHPIFCTVWKPCPLSTAFTPSHIRLPFICTKFTLSLLSCVAWTCRHAKASTQNNSPKRGTRSLSSMHNKQHSTSQHQPAPAYTYVGNNNERSSRSKTPHARFRFQPLQSYDEKRIKLPSRPRSTDLICPACQYLVWRCLHSAPTSESRKNHTSPIAFRLRGRLRIVANNHRTCGGWASTKPEPTRPHSFSSQTPLSTDLPAPHFLPALSGV